MVELIDTVHLGNDRVIGAHLVRHGLIVDPGPSSALGNWVERLAEPPRALMLTHIHLDHAGASGVLARRFPELRVYVHEAGAPHVVDPERLYASASRLYGAENMKRLWGEVAPVPEDRVVAVSGGEEVEGFRVAHTPGHAGNHVTYLDLDSGGAFVGDMGGVRIPPYDLTMPPTPPPEIDVEAWLKSLETIAALEPQRLHLTHFGQADDPGAQLEAVREVLMRNAELAKPGDREAFLSAFEAEIDAVADPESAVRMRQATPPDQQWLGLERYWRKRSEAEPAGRSRARPPLRPLQ
jgi:glyoxylase-like metal-dependent hydrolase (beta-lactamase superfamily II)